MACSLPLSLGTGLALLVASLTGAPVAAATGSPDCGAFDDPIYQRVNPTTTASLLTPWSAEAGKAVQYGYTDDRGVAFKASIAADDTLTPVHRLWQAGSGDFRYAADAEDVAGAVAKGYVDQGSRFSASRTSASCLSPVYGYVKNGHQRLAAVATDRTALSGAGWSQEGIAFYARAAEAVDTPTGAPDPSFSFAVLPDTQQEVLKAGDPRFLDRTQWLADHESSLDLRFATHTGDVVNWDTADHCAVHDRQRRDEAPGERRRSRTRWRSATTTRRPPASAASARDPARTPALSSGTRRRSTPTSTRIAYGDNPVEFESGKVDNLYSLYEAGGVQVDGGGAGALAAGQRRQLGEAAGGGPPGSQRHRGDPRLPQRGRRHRTGRSATATPPHSSSTISLIKQYANIKMVFSGHVGQADRRVDTGVNGNKVYSYLGAFHSDTTNPVRLVSVDVAAGTIKTWIYCPYTDETLSSYTVTETGVDFVR